MFSLRLMLNLRALTTFMNYVRSTWQACLLFENLLSKLCVCRLSLATHSSLRAPISNTLHPLVVDAISQPFATERLIEAATIATTLSLSD